jgi:hypothetical protein
MRPCLLYARALLNAKIEKWKKLKSSGQRERANHEYTAFDGKTLQKGITKGLQSLFFRVSEKTIKLMVFLSCYAPFVRREQFSKNLGPFRDYSLNNDQKQFTHVSTLSKRAHAHVCIVRNKRNLPQTEFVVVLLVSLMYSIK